MYDFDQSIQFQPVDGNTIYRECIFILQQEMGGNFFMSGTFLIASIAFVLSLITAIIQIRVHLQELRPYLSFAGTSEIIRLFEGINTVGMDFILMLENVGKCVLCYEVIHFDIFVRGQKLPDVDLKNKGSVIGIGAKTTYSKYINNMIPFNENLKPAEYVPPNYKISFSIEYYKVGKQKRKYKLSYDIDVEFEYLTRREFHGNAFAD